MIRPSDHWTTDLALSSAWRRAEGLAQRQLSSDLHAERTIGTVIRAQLSLLFAAFAEDSTSFLARARGAFPAGVQAGLAVSIVGNWRRSMPRQDKLLQPLQRWVHHSAIPRQILAKAWDMQSDVEATEKIARWLKKMGGTKLVRLPRSFAGAKPALPHVVSTYLDLHREYEEIAASLAWTGPRVASGSEIMQAFSRRLARNKQAKLLLAAAAHCAGILTALKYYPDITGSLVASLGTVDTGERLRRAYDLLALAAEGVPASLVHSALTHLDARLARLDGPCLHYLSTLPETARGGDHGDRTRRGELGRLVGDASAVREALRGRRDR